MTIGYHNFYTTSFSKCVFMHRPKKKQYVSIECGTHPNEHKSKYKLIRSNSNGEKQQAKKR